MATSMSDIIEQNTPGFSDGYPLGVPESYSWYKGLDKPDNSSGPPADFTSVLGWGQVYQKAGSPASSNPNAKVEVANAKTWVHLKGSGEWVLVQDQGPMPLEGGHFVTDFAGNAGTAMNVSNSGSSAQFAAPPNGYNDHFWLGARGEYAPGTVDAVYVQMDMRVNDPNVHLVANIGADWWRTPSAPYVDGFGNNPGAGMGNWVELSTNWSTLGYYSTSTAQFQANPPPVLFDTGSGATPTTPDKPVTPDNPITPNNPVTPDSPTTPDTSVKPTGPNLLVNGSFETTPTAVAAGGWSGFSKIAGWTALSGATIELWNNTNGVRATNGSNFGELDFLGARDGFYQDVRTEKGKSYDLSFDARSRPGFTSSTTTMEVLWNDQVVASVPPGANWQNYQFKVVGTGGADRLTFREAANQGADGLGALYDNVSLVAATSTTTPTTPTPPDTPSTPTQPVTSGRNLLVNGSFEDTPKAVDSGHWAGFSSVPGWTALTGGTIELWNNLNGVRATDGSKFGELDYLGARDGFYQDVRTEKGKSYDLSFDSRSRPGFTSSTTTMEVLWNGDLVASVPPGASWKNYQFKVVGTGGADRLTFREAANQSADGLGALYDNVSLVVSDAAATRSAATQSLGTQSVATSAVTQAIATPPTRPTAPQPALGSASGPSVAAMDRAMSLMNQYASAFGGPVLGGSGIDPSRVSPSVTEALAIPHV